MRCVLSSALPQLQDFWIKLPASSSICGHMGSDHSRISYHEAYQRELAAERAEREKRRREYEDLREYQRYQRYMMEKEIQEAQERQYKREKEMQEAKAHAEYLARMQNHRRQQLASQVEAKRIRLHQNASGPDTYEAKSTEFFQTFCDKVAEIQSSKKTAIPSVAVVGQNGVGKSSMINSLVGKEVTCTGVVDTTKDVYMCHENSHAQFYDVPGCSDERAYTNLKSIMAMKEMHLIMITYIDRV